VKDNQAINVRYRLFKRNESEIKKQEARRSSDTRSLLESLAYASVVTPRASRPSLTQDKLVHKHFMLQTDCN
jgi:hypothetical protein